MEINNQGNNRIGLLDITHNGETISWNASIYYQRQLSEPEGLFRDLNGYWGTLPVSRQDQIFALYKEIYEVLTTVANVNRMIERTRLLSIKLLDLHPIHELDYWLRMHSGMCFPSSLRDDYVENYTPERTYLRSDYQGLVTIALSMRVMLPIWGEFMRVVRENDERKEIMATRLLTGSKVYECKEMEKLRTIVNALCSDKTVSLEALFSFIGSEELPDYMFASTLVRSVAIGEISKLNQNINMVSNVHKHVTGKLEGLEKQRIVDKQGDSDNRSDDNSSNAESYRAKQDISPGDVVFHNVYAENAKRLATDADPTVDLEKLRICTDHFVDTLQERTGSYGVHQRLLIQWSLSRVMSPRAVPYLEPEAYRCALIATQTLLWHWGFNNLALLAGVTGRPRTDTDYGSYEARGRIPRDLQAKLPTLYPYYRAVGGAAAERRVESPANTAIDNFTKFLQDMVWISHNPRELVAAGTIGFVENELSIPSNIKTDLANFAVFCAETLPTLSSNVRMSTMITSKEILENINI